MRHFGHIKHAPVLIMLVVLIVNVKNNYTNFTPYNVSEQEQRTSHLSVSRNKQEVTQQNLSNSVHSKKSTTKNNLSTSEDETEKDLKSEREDELEPEIEKRPVSYSHPAYYSHIPKTGGFGALLTFNKIFKRKLAYKCARGNNRAIAWKDWIEKGEADKCYIIMSEDRLKLWEEYDGPKPEHVYTMVRPPREHILSQYIHCTETKGHRAGVKMMPSLDKWLEDWVGVMKKIPNFVNDEGQYKKTTVEMMKKKYNCFEPVERMSIHLRINPNVTKKELSQRFDVIGLLPFFTTSTCLMVIDVLKSVPASCDCSTETKRHKIVVQDHGVENHGDTMKISKEQGMLMNQLVPTDTKLYKLSEELFHEESEG
eukprot:CAMPEP_0194276418 /NCGR_PEP_ID=MMETSP0169-20130528/9030_1 /TAXON_ID=218684 /ORGANISM="Corethron pennatum, Strain L29A3" /LENGTH=367 /DNA_ID=CAMNT_0039020145 /DNA_START=122 /DNA_END=1226 /DNA_ORIENTATION=-